MVNAAHTDIERMYHHGMSATEIVNSMRGKLSRSAVYQRINSLDTAGIVAKPRGGSSPRIWTDRIIRKLDQLHDKHPLATPKQIRNQLNDATGSEFTIDAVKQKMRRRYGVARPPKRIIVLSDRNLAQRMEFYQQYHSKTARFWNRVCFSDEMSVRVIPDGRLIMVRPDCNGEYPVIDKRHSGGGQVMFWGVFSRFGVGPLVTVGISTIDSEKYTAMLEEHLIPFLEKYRRRMGGKPIFQQDGARSHTSKYTMANFFEMHREIEILFHPANSPDVNPIENIWGYIKTNINYGTIADAGWTKQAVINEVSRVWYSIDENYCKKLVHGMPARLKQLKNANFYNIEK